MAVETTAKRFEIDGIPVISPLLSLRKMEAIKTQILDSDAWKTKQEVNRSFQQPLLEALHKTGHLGQVTMAHILSNAGFTWKNRNHMISQIVKSCADCGMYKSNNNAISIRQSTINETRPKTQIASDISTIGSPAEFHFIIIVDIITGYSLAKRIHGGLSSINVARALLELLVRYAPNAETIVIDNASYFRSEVFKTFLNSPNLKVSYISRSNSRGNGACERCIRSYQDALRLMKLKTFHGPTIDLALEMCQLIINTRPRYGRISPYMLMHGHDVGYNPRQLPPLPSTSDMETHHLNLYERIKDLHEILSMYLQNPTQTPPIKLLQVGDLIRIKVPQPRNFTKITAPLYSEALFRITDVKKSSLTYKIENVQNTADTRVIHHRFTKLSLPLSHQKTVDDINNEHAKLKRIHTDLTERNKTHNMNLRSRQAQLTENLQPMKSTTAEPNKPYNLRKHKRS